MRLELRGGRPLRRVRAHRAHHERLGGGAHAGARARRDVEALGGRRVEDVARLEALREERRAQVIDETEAIGSMASALSS